MAEERTIFAEIEEVLADVGEPTLDRLEHTLTTGYAIALGLEAERSRLERQITDAATRLRGDGDSERAAQIAALARDLSAADEDIARLRSLLGTLRDRAVAARAA